MTGVLLNSANSFADLSGLSATMVMQSTGYIDALMIFDCQSAVLSLVSAFRVVVNGDAGLELRQGTAVAGTSEIGSVQHRAGPYGPGTYSAQGQFRVVSGIGSIEVDRGTIRIMGLTSV